MTSRRRFITLFGGAFGTSLLLAGCLGNPPDRSGSSGPVPQPDAAAAAKLETTTVKLGYIPILEAVPLVVGVQKGFFAKHGLKVELAKQASWPAARDNVVLGSAGGGIDGGQWQSPMPHLITEGIITDGKKVPMAVLAQLNSQANGFAVANTLKDDNLGLDLSPSLDVFKRFPEKEGRKFRAA